MKGVPTKLFGKTKTRPVMVQNDKGTEFLNLHVPNLGLNIRLGFLQPFQSERQV